jgi:hypothetical protein
VADDNHWSEHAGAPITQRILGPPSAAQIAKSGYIAMTRPMIALPYVIAMIAVIVTVDILIFRNLFWERLIVNIGIVLVFAAFYLRFLKHP